MLGNILGAAHILIHLIYTTLWVMYSDDSHFIRKPEDREIIITCPMSWYSFITGEGLNQGPHTGGLVLKSGLLITALYCFITRVI